MIPGVVSGAGSMSVSPYALPGQPPNQAIRPYTPVPNGFPTMPPPPQGMIPPPGLPRYPSPYVTMVRPVFPPRPPGAINIVPALSRPPVPGFRGPIILPIVRPAVVPSVTPTEKPQTTVYVGKISSTVENDFMLSLLQLCGSVKNWKRAQDPTNGTPKGFGFCEFDDAEGVLRALRLLSKLNVDGLEWCVYPCKLQWVATETVVSEEYALRGIFLDVVDQLFRNNSEKYYWFNINPCNQFILIGYLDMFSW
ncbi:hypothetical protein F0562_033638 [Nyssa sinensis]|uniref:RRM domain-containing protein n=1 Tax=Nyssa sinensis TaxID=561372 RepID=A0A5J5AF15_9ASTE|nr:hypothetical protein F0562_033638 [Nyssa sinensis]